MKETKKEFKIIYACANATCNCKNLAIFYGFSVLTILDLVRKHKVLADNSKKYSLIYTHENSHQRASNLHIQIIGADHLCSNCIANQHDYLLARCISFLNLKFQALSIILCGCTNWPRGYKSFFKLSSTEHEISTAHKC